MSGSTPAASSTPPLEAGYDGVTPITRGTPLDATAAGRRSIPDGWPCFANQAMFDFFTNLP